MSMLTLDCFWHNPDAVLLLALPPGVCGQTANAVEREITIRPPFCTVSYLSAARSRFSHVSQPTEPPHPSLPSHPSHPSQSSQPLRANRSPSSLANQAWISTGIYCPPGRSIVATLASDGPWPAHVGLQIGCHVGVLEQNMALSRALLACAKPLSPPCSTDELWDTGQPRYVL